MAAFIGVTKVKGISSWQFGYVFTLLKATEMMAKFVRKEEFQA